MDYSAFARHLHRPDLIVYQQRCAFHPEHIILMSKANSYRLAMRLIEKHGDGAEIAAILRAEQISDEGTREAVLSAITELRSSGDQSRAH